MKNKRSEKKEREKSRFSISYKDIYKNHKSLFLIIVIAGLFLILVLSGVFSYLVSVAENSVFTDTFNQNLTTEANFTHLTIIGDTSNPWRGFNYTTRTIFAPYFAGDDDNSYYHNFQGRGFVQVTRNESFEVQNLTISLWIKFNAVATGTQQVILTKRYPDGSPGGGYQIDHNTIGSITFSYDNGTAAAPQDTYPGLSAGGWYHILGTINDTTYTICTNTVCTSAAKKGDINYSDLQPIKFGSAYSGIGAFLNGSLDNILFLNRSLNSTEITSLYNLGRKDTSYTDPSLVSVWRFDNTNLSNAFDSIGQNNGTFNGNASYGYDSLGLVAYYPFDVAEVNTANKTYDYSNNNYDGTLINGTIFNMTGCLYGNCYTFDGVNDYITLADKLSPGFNNFTVSAWIKNNATLSAAGNEYSIVGNTVGSTSKGYSFYLRGGTWNGTYFRINNGSTNFDTQPSLSYNSNLSNNVWHYLAVSVNRNGNVTIYLDNVQIGARDVSSLANFSIAGTNNFRIGYNDDYFNGSIDEVMIFNTALNSSQISDIYNNQSRRFVNATGIQTVKQINITSGYNLVNLTLDSYSRPFKSNISARLGMWDVNSNVIGTGSSQGASAYKDYDLGMHWAQFNGSGHIDFGNPPQANFETNNFSVTIWIKNNQSLATSSNIYGIINKFINNAVPGWQLFLRGGSYNGILFRIGAASGLNDTYPSVSYNSTLSDNNWHFIGLTRLSGGNATIYLDGVQIVSSINNLNASCAGNLYLGDGDGTNQRFNGSIDEVMIFNKSLSASEVSNLYNLGRDIPYYNDANLVSWWGFDRGNSVDKKGNNSGTDTAVVYNQSNSLSNGLVSYYHFDEASWNGSCYDNETEILALEEIDCSLADCNSNDYVCENNNNNIVNVMQDVNDGAREGVGEANKDENGASSEGSGASSEVVGSSKNIDNYEYENKKNKEGKMIPQRSEHVFQVDSNSLDNYINLSIYDNYDAESALVAQRSEHLSEKQGLPRHLGSSPSQGATSASALNINSEDTSQKCYIKKWKYFEDLKDNEKVMTLNNETGEKEWQLPSVWQEFNNSQLGGEMYRIKLEDGSELLVSEKHKVYSSEELYLGDVLNPDKDKINNLPLNSEGLMVFNNLLSEYCNESIKGGFILKNIIPNDSLGGNLSLFKKSLSLVNITLCSDLAFSNIFESLDFNLTRTISNPLSDKTLISPIGIFSSATNEALLCDKSFIFNSFRSQSKTCKNSFLVKFRVVFLNDTFNCDSCTKESYDIFDKDSSIFECQVASTDFIICNNKGINLSSHSGNNIILNLNNYRLQKITDDSLTTDVQTSNLDKDKKIAEQSSENSDNISNLMQDKGEEQVAGEMGISNNKVNVSSFSLQKITDVYSSLQNKPDNEIYFLNSENNPVIVESIEKVPYNGMIYDVDVENDIVLVKRGNSSEIWSGNSGEVKDAMGINNGTAQNSSGRANTTGVGVYGRAGSFDGVNGYVNMSATINMSQLTMAAWFKYDAVDSNTRYIVSSRVSNDGALIYMSDVNLLFWYNSVQSLITPRPSAGVWHFVVGVYNGTYTNFYLDGVLRDYDAVSALGNNTRITTIGSANSFTAIFNGSIDEVMIFNRSLSSDEIKELYVKGRANWNYTAYQNLSSVNSFDNSSANIFNISANAANLLGDFILTSDINQFLSPNLRTSAGLNFNILDTVAPSATLLLPSNASYYNNGTSINFTANITDNPGSGIANATLNVIDTGGNTWMNFNGASGYVSVPSILVRSSGNWSTSAWVNFKGASILGSILGNYIFNLDYLNRIASYDDIDAAYIRSNGAITTNAWNYVAIVCNRTNISFYINGVLDSSKSYTCNSSGNGQYGFTSIGSFNAGVTYDFNGSIDEVRIYNRSLSASEITTIYNSGLNRNSNLNNSGLVAWYDFQLGSDGNTTRLVDVANGLNNGTIIGGANFTSTYTSKTSYTSGGTLTTAVGMVVSLVDSVYKWFYNIFDFSGNQYTTANNTLTVDTVFPTYTLSSPVNGQYFNTSTPLFNISMADTNNGSIIPNLDGSLVSWWRMDDTNSSGGVVDYMGRNNGTNVGANQTDAGKFGKAMSFNTSNYVNVGNNNTLWLNNIDFTISVWAKPTSSGGWCVLSKGQGTTRTGYAIYAVTSNWYFMYSNTTSSIDQNVVINGVTINSWQHLVMVVNKSGGILTPYLNGQNGSNLNISLIDFDNSGYNLLIGNSNGYYFNGSIDDVMIFNRSLTLNEIQALYNATALSHNNISLADGNHTLNTYVQDYAGNVNSTGLISFVTDTVNPSATLLLPSNNSYLNYSSNINFTVNISDASAGIKNATLNVWNDTALVNQTLVADYSSGGTLNTVVGVVVTLVDSVYKWFYNIFDFSGNQFVSANNTLTVDTTYPLINFSVGTPENNTGRPGEFTANISITELNLANVTWNFNGTISVFNASCYNFSSIVNLTCNITNTSSTAWTVLFNQSGMSAGNTYFYNVSVRDLAGNLNNTETRLIKGAVAPSYVSIVQNPIITDYDNLDPLLNVTVTANLSDIDNNFDTAILQWMNSSTNALWNNVTMDVIGSKGINTIVNSTFTLPIYESNITYRIWANDTVGESSNSSLYTVLSFWDCTWNITTDISAAAGWDTNKRIGNIIINNTGDSAFSNNNCSLTFRLTHDMTAGRIYFDGSSLKPSNSFIINAKANRTVVVNATFLTEVKQESFVISIRDISGISGMNISQTYERNVSGTIVSNQAGPYLYQTMTSYPTTLYLTPGNFSLDGYLRNLMGNSVFNENNTAYNVSFYWSLPSQLTNVSGNTNLSFNNINDSDLHYNNINVSFADLASATSGIKTVYLYSQGVNLSGSLIVDANNNSLLTNAINISFLCYNATDGVCVTSCGYTQDFDCPVPVAGTASSGGGGGGGGGAPRIEKSEATFELLAGKEQDFNLKIENKLANPKTKIKISVSGINSEYIKIIPDRIERIEPSSSREVNVRITAPAYFSKGTYKLTFIIEGKVSIGNQEENFIERKIINLGIIEVSKEETDIYLNDSIGLIEDMKNSNLSVNEVNDLYNQMLSDYKNLDYAAVKSNYEKINSIKEAAFEAYSIIEDLTAKIKEAEYRGISVLETKKILYTSIAAFNRGDYTLALQRLNEAKLTFAAETKGEFNLLYTVKNNPVQTTAGLLGLLVFGFATTMAVRFNLYKNKLKMLSEEEKLLLELMKVVQRECFENNRMSMEEYEQAMAQYENKLSETIEERIRIETRLANMMKVRGKKQALVQEKERLIAMVKELQDQYLNKAKIETRIYDNMLKSYSTRLAEVEEQLTFLDAEEALGENKWSRRLLKAVRLG